MRADSMQGSAKTPIFEEKDEKSGLNDKLTRENEIRSEFVLINVFSFLREGDGDFLNLNGINTSSIVRSPRRHFNYKINVQTRWRVT